MSSYGSNERVRRLVPITVLLYPWRDPSGKTIADVDTNYRIPKTVNEDYPMTVNFVAGFSGLTFPNPGIYHVVVSGDDAELDRVPLILELPDEERHWKSQAPSNNH